MSPTPELREARERAAEAAQKLLDVAEIAARKLLSEAAEAAAKLRAEGGTSHTEQIREDIAEVKSDLGRLASNVSELASSVLGLQRGSLRVLGAGSLLGGCLIFVLSRALGL